MNTPAVLDDYLHDLLGELGTATVAPSLALVVEETAVTAGTSPDAADTPAPPIAKIEAPPALAIAPVRPVRRQARVRQSARWALRRRAGRQAGLRTRRR